MALTRRTLLKRASIAGLALAFGKLELPTPVEPMAIPAEVIPAAASLPVGWLPLDGRTIRAGDYPQLHKALRGVYWPGTAEPEGYDDIEFAVPDLRGHALGAYMQDPIASPHMATNGPYAGQIHWKIKTDEETA